MAESSSAPQKTEKPVVVRVKRKASQSCLDAFWLEISERPSKRPLIDFEKLSISDSSSSRVGEWKTNKIFVQHIETVTNSEETFDVLRSFMPNASDGLESEKNIAGRCHLKTTNRQAELLTKAKQRQEVLSRNARFEQIWRSRRGKKEAPEDEAVYEMCRLYDVARVDDEEHKVEVQREKDTDIEDCRMMAEFLPLLREVLPTAASEIEDDIICKQASSDGYVYDFYAVKEGADVSEVDDAGLFPSIQVEDEDDFYDGPDDSDCETDDSNAENNPLNDYPDEEISEDEDEITSKSSNGISEVERDSGDESEETEIGSQVSYKYEDSRPHDFDDEFYCDGDDDFGDEEWR